ncbi:MAG: GNAT family N-acetyltransferase [Firmicutes bacterium]|nr:GNAT family N-acetyltransferase [Bacillota bacterium]
MIRRAAIEDLNTVCELTLKLWPDNSKEEIEELMLGVLKNKKSAIFFAEENGKSIGFAYASLRYDYVEGTSSSPVGYLEGVYTEPNNRLQGLAKELVEACQNWAKAQGCREFASDSELSNLESLKFHLNIGFQEANRIICFTKKL